MCSPAGRPATPPPRTSSTPASTDPPAMVARPLDARDVRDAIRFTVGHGLPVRARSGGHSYAGYSTLNGGVVLDLRLLNDIAFDRGTGTATVSAGVQLIDLYSSLASHGVTVPGGSCPSVGVSGVTLGGGMGLAGRRFGLTLDSVVALQIVTADGQSGRSLDRRTRICSGRFAAGAAGTSASSHRSRSRPTRCRRGRRTSMWSGRGHRPRRRSRRGSRGVRTRPTTSPRSST